MSRFVDEDIPLVRAARGDAPALKPVNVRPPFFKYLSLLWQRRHFVKKQSWVQAIGQHQDTLLGNLWLIFGPLLDGFVYFLIFGVLFPRARAGIDNFFGYLVIGVFMFSFTSRSITGCARSIDQGRGLIRAFPFPKAVLPISVLLREVVAMGPTVYTLVILLLVVPPRAELGEYWLFVPLVFTLQFFINLGLGFIFARLGAVFVDLKHLLPYFMRFLMYASCVLWTIDRFDQFPSPVPEIANNNPFFILLDSYRDLLLSNQLPPEGHWIRLGLWASLSMVLGLIFFWAGEVQYGRRANN